MARSWTASVKGTTKSSGKNMVDRSFTIRFCTLAGAPSRGVTAWMTPSSR